VRESYYSKIGAAIASGSSTHHLRLTHGREQDEAEREKQEGEQAESKVERHGGEEGGAQRRPLWHQR
jgi:hypothetical protein